MTFCVSSGNRPPYSAMHGVMARLRLTTTLFRWVEWSSCFVLCGFTCKYVDRGDCDVWMPQPVEMSGVWSYGGRVRGVLRSMLKCPTRTVVTVPYLPLCCVRCYMALIVSSEARCTTVRTVLAMAGGLCRLRCRKRRHCGRRYQ